MQPPPWARCDVLNGTALLVIELSTLRLRNRWAVVFPALFGLLWTCGNVSRGDPAFKTKYPFYKKQSVGAVAAVARTAYSVLELALLVASITRMLESDHRTWGPMASIPLLVMGMMCSSRAAGETLESENGGGVMMPDAICSPPQAHQDGGGSPKSQYEPNLKPSNVLPTTHSPHESAGDELKAALSKILQTVVITDTMSNALAVAAGIVVLFSTSQTSSLLTPPNDGKSFLAGIAYDDHAYTDDDNPIAAMMLMFLLLPSTPVFGGGRDIVLRSTTLLQVRDLGNNNWFPVVTSASSAVWLCLLFSLRVPTPSTVSWSGALMVISCSLLLVDSFKEWGANLRVAWVMSTVLLGLVIGQSNVGWVRVGLHAAIGIVRCVMMSTDPFILERMYDLQQCNLIKQFNHRLAQDSMFRLDRLQR